MKTRWRFLPAGILSLVLSTSAALCFEGPKTAVDPTLDENIPRLTKEADEELLFATVHNTTVVPRPAPQFRKDSWQWYWKEEAQLAPGDLDAFFGNTFVSHWMKDLTNMTIIPAWDNVMRYDFVRALTLLLLAGSILTFQVLCLLALIEATQLRSRNRWMTRNQIRN